MQQPQVSLTCDSGSSCVFIGVFRPRRLMGTCSSEELIGRITSIALSFNPLAKTAIFKSRNSNHVAIFSVWEKDASGLVELRDKRVNLGLSSRRVLNRLRRSFSRRSLSNVYPVPIPLSITAGFEKALSKVSHVVHMSWYEVSCGDCKEMKAAPSPSSTQISSSLSSPSLLHGGLSLPSSLHGPSALSRSISCQNLMEDGTLPSVSCTSPSTMHKDEEKSGSSSPCSTLTPSPPTSPSLHSLALTPTVHLSLGDTVHLRCVIGGRRADLQDVLSYSCLAILKAYFPQTEGLHSYTFYRSLDGSRMAGLGVWQGADSASTFLNAPDGACEERYWRSMGAKTRFEIYEVAALVI